MGNAELRTIFKGSLKENQQQSQKLGLTTEILLEDSLVDTVWAYIKENMKIQHDGDHTFLESNIQLNEQSEDLAKQQLIAELNENYIAGFSSAQGNIEMLNQPTFENTFTVHCPESTLDYTKLQYQKLAILYALFVQKYKEQQDKKQNFFEYIQRFLEKNDVNQRIQVGLESGFKFSLSLLKELKSINPDMLVNSLEYLYQTLKNAEPGSLYSTDKISFMIDANLNDARAFLLSIIQEKTSNQRCVELAYKIILLIGIARSNVEDLLLICTLLQNEGTKVDLRNEINLFKEEALISAVNEKTQARDYTERKSQKQGKIFYLKAEPYKTEIQASSALACDGEYIYLHQKGLGLLKIGTGSQGQMIGHVYLHKPDYRKDEDVTLLALNNQLLCRSESIKPRPFVVINSQTLEEQKDEVELENVEKNLEWKENSKSGRFLTYTPLISDGSFVYAIVQQKSPSNVGQEGEDNENDEDNSSKPPQLIVEKYDASLPSLPFVDQIKLYINEDEAPFVREENSIEFLKKCSFATDGNVLLLQTQKKSLYFDLKTGILVSSVKLKLFEGSLQTSIVFDYNLGVCYQIKQQSSDVNIEALMIKNFQKAGAVQSQFAKQYLSNRIKANKSLLQEGIKQSSESAEISQYNLIQRIMLDVTTPVLIQNSKKEGKSQILNDIQSNQLQRSIILWHLSNGCSKFQEQLSSILAQGLSVAETEENLISFFKYPNATYLTHSLFLQMRENLDRSVQLIKGKKSSANLVDSYNFYFLLKILSANFDALNFCKIILTELLNKDACAQFLQSYRNCVISLIEQGYSEEFESGSDNEENKSLWKEIYAVSLKMISTSMNILYSNPSDIINKLLAESKEIKDSKQAESCATSFGYLSKIENIKKLILSKDDELLLLVQVFKQSCQIQQNDKLILTTKDQNQILKHDDFIYNTLRDPCQRFIRNFSEQVIIQFSALKEQIQNKSKVQGSNNTEKDLQEKQKLQQLETAVIAIYQESCHQLEKNITIFNKNLEDKYSKNISQDEVTEVASKYLNYSKQMETFVKANSPFYQIITLYVQTFSILKLSTSFLPLTTQSTINLVRIASEYIEKAYAFNKINKIEKDQDKLTQCIEKISRNLTWFVGLISYKLINLKQDEQSQEKKDKQSSSEKLQRLILQSNLFSGGIESKFILLFNQETQQNLKDLIRISNDKETELVLNSQLKLSEEDELLVSIIQQGKDSKVDIVITYLQQILERKVPFVPYARLGGTDGMRLTRAAFAVMIKFSEFFDDFVSLVDEVDMKLDDLSQIEKQEKDVQVKEYIKSLTNYEHIQKRYESASKMRQWVNEKKKTLIEQIRKEVEIEFINEKRNNLKKSKTQNKEQENEIVQIDTTTNNVVAQVKEGSELELTENDKTSIDDIADNKFNSELQKIYGKIVEKSEFIVKLQVPSSYLVKEQAKKGGSLLFIREPTQRNENKNENDQVGTEFDWKDRLKNWRQIQTSKGAVTGFNDRKKEIFESSVLSILACLQSSIQVQKIRRYIELVFLNASKRIVGLILLSDLVNINLPSQQLQDVSDWFCSSFRANKNQQAHYLDDIKGCGNHLEEQTKLNFFAILKSFVNQLKSSDNEQEIKQILNTLKWKYTARDHSLLQKLQIFEVLHQGNGSKNNKLKKIWGKQLIQKVEDNNKGGIQFNQLPNEVISLFEQIFLQTIGRIIRPDSNEQQKQRKGSGLPTLQKAVSSIDINVSDILVGSVVKILFQEFERYINIMEISKGIDWALYVKKRNRGELDLQQDHNINLLDEAEEVKQETENLKQETNNTSQKEEDTTTTEPIKSTEEIKVEEEQASKVSEDLNQSQKDEFKKHQQERGDKETRQVHQHYSESFLLRLLRLLEILTSLATQSSYISGMVQKQANQAQIELLVSLVLHASPKIKIIAFKAIQNLIQINISSQKFEQAIKSMTNNPDSLAYQIQHHTTPKVKFEGSLFIQFLYNYVLKTQHKMWTKAGLSSVGQYSATQEAINTLRIILESAPQADFQKAVQSKIKQVLFEPLENWNIEEIDIVFSILPSSSFSRLMTGSEAIYKDSSKVIILGFSDCLESEQTLNSLDEDKLKKYSQTINIQEPSTQQAIVLFNGDDQQGYNQIIRAVDITHLLAIPNQTQRIESSKSSILYDNDIIKRFIEIFEIETNDKTQLSVRQAQVQILKAIYSLIDNEWKDQRASNYLNFLKQQKLLNPLLQHIQRNANKPDISGQSQQTLPIDLVELSLSSLRINALEGQGSLLKAQSLIAKFSGQGTLIFYEPSQNNQPFLLESAKVKYTINENIIIQNKISTIYNVEFFDKIKQNPELLQNDLEIVIFEDQDLVEFNEVVVQALKKAKLIAICGQCVPLDFYKQLVELEKIHNFTDPIYQKPMIILDEKNLKKIKGEYIRSDSFKRFNSKKEQLDDILTTELQQWGGFSDEQIEQINKNDKSDACVESVLKIKEAILDNSSQQESDIKKILIGKMAFQTRKQNTANLSKGTSAIVYEDQGIKIWNESLKAINLESQIIQPLGEIISVQLKVEQNQKDKKKYYEQVLKQGSNKDVQAIESQYISSLNKLLKVHSRRALITFLNYMDPLPFDILDNMTDLNKLILIAHNEGLQIKDLTGNKSILKSIKEFLQKLSNDEQMGEYLYDFLTNQVIKPSCIVVQKIINDKNFLKNASFESEVDAQMYPTPSFIRSITKMLIKNSAQTLLDNRGLIPNLLSVLVSLSFAYTVRNPKEAQAAIKLLTVAIKLLNFVNDDPSKYKYIDDILNLHILAKISAEIKKVINIKKSEPSKLLCEVYYSLTQLGQWNQDNKKRSYVIETKKQEAKLKKTADFIVSKDVVQLIQLSKSEKTKEVMNILDEKIKEIRKNYKGHSEGYRVPFIAKIKSLQNSDGILIKMQGVQDDLGNDHFNMYYDPEGIYKVNKELSPDQDIEILMKKEIYVVYSQDISNSLMTFGTATKGKLGNANMTGEFGIKRANINHNILKIESAQYHTVILNDKNEAFRSGKIKGSLSSSSFEALAKQVKLITAGRSNIAIVSNDNTVYQFGKNKANHFTKEGDATGELYKQEFDQQMTENIVGISSGTHFTICVTEAGNLYGSGDQFLLEIGVEPKQGKLVKIPLQNGIIAKQVWCSKAKNSFTAIIDAKDGEEKYLMSAGIHFRGLLGQGSFIEQSNTFEKLEYDHITNVITQVSLYSDHAFALTENGDLFGWGSNEGFRLGFEGKVKQLHKMQPLTFFSDRNRFKILNFSCGDDHSLVQVEEKNQFGNLLGPRLYQVGNDRGQSDPQHRGVNKDLLKEQNNIAKISEFDDKAIQSIGTGLQCSFVYRKEDEKPQNDNISWVQNHIKHEIAKEIYQSGVIHLYHDPNNNQELPQVEESKDIDADHSPDKKSNSNEEVKIGTQVSDSGQKLTLREQKKIEKEKVKQEQDEILEQKRKARQERKREQQIELQKMRAGDPQKHGWHFYTQAQIQDKQNVPNLSIAIKHGIPDLYQKIELFREILNKANAVLGEQAAEKNYDHKLVCSDCGDQIVGVRYYASYQSYENLKEVNLCETCFQQPTEFDVVPLVYYRLHKSPSEETQLPLIDLNQFFNPESNFKFEFSVGTHRKQFNNKQVLSDLLKQVDPNIPHRQNFIRLLKSKLNKQHESKILGICEDSSIDEFENFVTLYLSNEKEILRLMNGQENDIEDDVKSKIKTLLRKFNFMTPENVLEVYDTVLFMQNYFQITMPLLEKVSNRSLKNESVQSLPVLKNRIAKNVPFVIKNEMITSQISQLPTGDTYELTIRRRRAQALAESGGCDNDGTQSIFGQLMQELKKNPIKLKCFQINSSDSRIFKVEFKGEGSIDAGGPYRDTMTNLCQELQSGILPLLIPTPNNKNNHGQYRECWTVNPSSVSPTHLEMFKYLGYYIGMAIRSEQALPLDLAPIFWKNILEDHLIDTDQQKELNLKEFDTFSWQVLEDLRAQAKGLSQDEFEAVIEEPFVTLLSDGTEVELLPGGRDKRVTQQNLDQYISLVANTRINEASRQFKAIIEGINFVIPSTIWKMLSWKQIEKRATGSKILDLDKLKEITNYECGSSTDPHVKIFWDALESFTDEQKSLYLKFVWGRARLPARTESRHVIKSMDYNPMSNLPISHTCFFTLDLPRYPEFQVCRDKILFAITFCGDIDADRSSYAIENDD